MVRLGSTGLVIHPAWHLLSFHLRFARRGWCSCSGHFRLLGPCGRSPLVPARALAVYWDLSFPGKCGWWLDCKQRTRLLPTFTLLASVQHPPRQAAAWISQTYTVTMEPHLPVTVKQVLRPLMDVLVAQKAHRQLDQQKRAIRVDSCENDDL